MRILVLDADAELRESLAALLRRRGHELSDAATPDVAADLIVLGLPAPPELTPAALPKAPLLLLLGPPLPFGELERWAAEATRWSLLWKPARESAIEALISRIEQRLAGVEHPDGAALRFEPPPRS